jgi:hypothetical protein
MIDPNPDRPRYLLEMIPHFGFLNDVGLDASLPISRTRIFLLALWASSPRICTSPGSQMRVSGVDAWDALRIMHTREIPDGLRAFCEGRPDRSVVCVCCETFCECSSCGYTARERLRVVSLQYRRSLRFYPWCYSQGGRKVAKAVKEMCIWRTEGLKDLML